MADVIETEVVVLGSGPGGYTAAFRLADLGKKVVLVERQEMGGVCLNVGCIPSKALLHVAKVISEVEALKNHGVQYGSPQITLSAVKEWKESVVKRLTTGLKGLAKQRKVQMVLGEGVFEDDHTLKVQTSEGEQKVRFQQAIIAVGSRPVELPFLPKDPRIMDSTGALELEAVPARLLIIGGGIIGMEMATIYQALGSSVSVVEWMESLLPGADKDLVAPLQKRMQNLCENIWLKTKVTEVKADNSGLKVSFEGASQTKQDSFDRILCSVGRVPNGKLIQADKAGVHVDERGFIPVDNQQRTNVPHIFAIGDVVGNPMLAHKAIPEGRVAAEVIAGHHRFFQAACIPSVAYTDPEVAWVGMTEAQLQEQGRPFGKGVFPWMASGRSLSLGRDEGFTKILFDKISHRVVGAGIVGPNAGDLIAEVGLAIEMGCEAEDLALTIHPHPTLSETVALAAEMFEGTITDLMPKKQ